MSDRVHQVELYLAHQRLEGPLGVPASVAVPYRLASLGIDAVIPPQPDLAGRPYSALDEYSVIVYPFVEGRNAFKTAVSDEQRRYGQISCLTTFLYLFLNIMLRSLNKSIKVA